MKHRTRYVFLLASCLVWTSCGSDESPMAPLSRSSSPLVGTYAFVSVTDKASNTTLNAGDVADLDGAGALPEGAITGSLEMTETTTTFRWTATPSGAVPVTAVASGTHTISGSTITFRITDSTITVPVPLGTDTLTFTIDGNRLTLEDDEKRFVYVKQ